MFYYLYIPVPLPIHSSLASLPYNFFLFFINICQIVISFSFLLQHNELYRWFFSSWHYIFTEYLTKCFVYTLNKRRREKNFFTRCHRMWYAAYMKVRIPLPLIVSCSSYSEPTLTSTFVRIFNISWQCVCVCVRFVSRLRSNVTNASQSYSEENVTEVTLKL